MTTFMLNNHRFARMALLLCCLAIVVSARCQVRQPQHSDTVMCAVAGSLFAIGLTTHLVPTLDNLNTVVKENVQQWRLTSVLQGRALTIDNYLQLVPLATPLVLKGLGLRSQSDWVNLMQTEAVAFVSMSLLTQYTKILIAERRPDSWSLNSFPSGHTATAFVGAELCRSEFSDYPWVGISAYAVATVVAALRIYNDRHWLGDVIGGAGVGILSARLAYGLNQRLNRWWAPQLAGFDRSPYSRYLL